MLSNCIAQLSNSRRKPHKPSTTSYLPSYIRQNGECSTKIGAIYYTRIILPAKGTSQCESNVMAQCSKLQASDHAASPYMVRDLHCRWIRVFIGRFTHVLNSQSQCHMHFQSKYAHMLIISSQRYRFTFSLKPDSIQSNLASTRICAIAFF